MYYDGECPVCRNFLRYIRLRSSFDVSLINAREVDASELPTLPFSKTIDEGIIVVFENSEILHGDSAMHFLAIASTRSNVFNTLVYYAFRNKKISRTIYPALVFARLILLKILGRGNILG